MRIARVETVHRKGTGAENEDAIVLAGERAVFAVVDGASALGEAAPSGRLAAVTVAGVLAEAAGTTPLPGAVARANAALGAATSLSATPAGGGGTSRAGRGSCGLVAARVFHDGAVPKLEYVQAGDCMLFVEYAGGAVRTATHDPIARLDGCALERLREAWSDVAGGEDPNGWEPDRRDAGFREVRRRIAGILEANRARLNTPDGYGALDGSAEALRYLESGVVNLHQASKVLLATDGLLLPAPDGAASGTWTETARYAFGNGLAALEARVLELEASDPACFRYPRFKPSDDKTGILLHLEAGGAT